GPAGPGGRRSPDPCGECRQPGEGRCARHRTARGADRPGRGADGRQRRGGALLLVLTPSEAAAGQAVGAGTAGGTPGARAGSGGGAPLLSFDVVASATGTGQTAAPQLVALALQDRGATYLLTAAMHRNAAAVQDWSSIVAAATGGPAWDEGPVARAGAAAEAGKRGRAVSPVRSFVGADARLAEASAGAPDRVHPGDALGAAGALAVSGWLLMNTRVS